MNNCYAYSEAQLAYLANQQNQNRTLPRADLSTNSTSQSSLNNISRLSKNSLNPPEGVQSEPSRYSLSSQNDAQAESEGDLIVMTIDIGNGKKDMLRIRENDVPFDLAYNFCIKHNLNMKIVEILAENIKNNMDAARKAYLEEEAKEEHDNSEEVKNQEDEEDIYYSNELAEHTLHEQMENRNSAYNMAEDQFYEHKSFANDKRFQTETDNEYRYRTADGMLNAPSNLRTEQTKRDSNKETSRSRKSCYNDEPGPSAHRVSMRNRNGKKGYYHSGNLNQYIFNSTGIQKIWQGLNNSFDVASYGRLKNESKSTTAESHIPQINSNSKTIVRSKDSVNRVQKLTVYERLFNEAKKRSKSPKPDSALSKSFCGGGRSGSKGKEDRGAKKNKQHSVEKRVDQSLTYGERLYQRAIKHRESQKYKHLFYYTKISILCKRRSLENKRKEEEREKEKDFTYHPQINEISNIIYKYKRQNQKVEDFLTNFGKKARESKEKKRSVISSLELKNCSFHPKINQISKIINYEMENKENVDRFSKLYEHSMRVERKKEAIRSSLNRMHSFKPEINEVSEELVRGQDFFERLEKFASLKNEKIRNHELSRIDQSHIDPVTGQELFKPTVGRPPKSRRNNEGLPIGELLYRARFEKERNLDNITQKIEKELLSKKPQLNETSQKLMEKKRRNRLKEIFDMLDSDEDGFISAQKVCIKTIPIPVLEAFTPIFCEMEELNQELNFEEFHEASERLLATLTVSEKAQILGLCRSKTPPHNEHLTFKPEVNKISKELARNHRPQGYLAFYEFLNNEKKLWNEKVKKLQIQKEEEEMRECVFHPHISNPPRSREISHNQKLVGSLESLSQKVF